MKFVKITFDTLRFKGDFISLEYFRLPYSEVLI